MKTKGFTQTVFMLCAAIPLSAGSAPVGLAGAFDLPQPDVSHPPNCTAQGTAAETSLDERLLDQLQATRLREIPGLKGELDKRCVPTRLEGQLGFYSGDDPDAELRRLIQELGAAYRAVGTERLTQSSAHVNEAAIGVYRIAESINGLWVHGSSFMIITNANTGEITRIKSRFLPDRGLPKEPEISPLIATQMAAEAIAHAENAQLQDIDIVDEPELVYHIDGYLGWRFVLGFRINGEADQEMIVINSIDGSLIERADTIIP
ncbi:MAG: hypothetical protein ACREVN_12070 [Gammaproteobacteria bacterium]